MAKYSYQDIDTRLRVIEDKVDFILKSFTVRDQKGETKNLLDTYIIIKASGVELLQHAD